MEVPKDDQENIMRKKEEKLLGRKVKSEPSVILLMNVAEEGSTVGSATGL